MSQCPICKKPRKAQFKPFCSARCKDRDLASWFNGSYAVPGERVNPEDYLQDNQPED